MLCGACKYYDEWKNGYCKKQKEVKEPEDKSCKEYESQIEEVCKYAPADFDIDKCQYQRNGCKKQCLRKEV